MGNLKETERRKFPRVKALVYYRNPRILTPKHRAADISLNGIRIYSDELLEKGKRIEIEIFLPKGSSITAIARVVWAKKLDSDAKASYDIGLEFLSFPPWATQELKRLIENSL